MHTSIKAKMAESPWKSEKDKKAVASFLVDKPPEFTRLLYAWGKKHKISMNKVSEIYEAYFSSSVRGEKLYKTSRLEAMYALLLNSLPDGTSFGETLEQILTYEGSYGLFAEKEQLASYYALMLQQVSFVDLLGAGKLQNICEFAEFALQASQKVDDTKFIMLAVVASYFLKFSSKKVTEIYQEDRRRVLFCASFLESTAQDSILYGEIGYEVDIQSQFPKVSEKFCDYVSGTYARNTLATSFDPVLISKLLGLVEKNSEVMYEENEETVVLQRLVTENVILYGKKACEYNLVVPEAYNTLFGVLFATSSEKKELTVCATISAIKALWNARPSDFLSTRVKKSGVRGGLAHLSMKECLESGWGNSVYGYLLSPQKKSTSLQEFFGLLVLSVATEDVKFAEEKNWKAEELGRVKEFLEGISQKLIRVLRSTEMYDSQLGSYIVTKVGYFTGRVKTEEVLVTENAMRNFSIAYGMFESQYSHEKSAENFEEDAQELIALGASLKLITKAEPAELLVKYKNMMRENTGFLFYKKGSETEPARAHFDVASKLNEMLGARRKRRGCKATEM